MKFQFLWYRMRCSHDLWSDLGSVFSHQEELATIYLRIVDDDHQRPVFFKIGSANRLPLLSCEVWLILTSPSLDYQMTLIACLGISWCWSYYGSPSSDWPGSIVRYLLFVSDIPTILDTLFLPCIRFPLVFANASIILSAWPMHTNLPSWPWGISFGKSEGQYLDWYIATICTVSIPMTVANLGSSRRSGFSPIRVLVTARADFDIEVRL